MDEKDIYAMERQAKLTLSVGKKENVLDKKVAAVLVDSSLSLAKSALEAANEIRRLCAELDEWKSGKRAMGSQDQESTLLEQFDADNLDEIFGGTA